jgi:hypothetical protein
MKKILLAVFLTASVTATAGDGKNSIQFAYALRDTVGDQSENPNRQGINIKFSRKITDSLTWDAGQEFRTERLNSEDGTSSTRLDTGLSYQIPVTSAVSVYTRGGVGYKFTTNDDNTYYSVEPGIKLQVTDPLNIRFAWRYRDSFNDRINDQTHTVRFGAEYALSKESVLTANIDRFYGDSEAIGYTVGYVIKF